MTGFGSDQSIPTRLVSAKGDLIVVTEEAYPDLPYAIRGEGQFLGLVTQITIRAHPLSLLRTNGSIWAGIFISPPRSNSAASHFPPLGPPACNRNVRIQNASDARAALGAKGGFKSFGLAGLHGFDIGAFLQTIEVWTQLVTDCPDAVNTVFNFQWDSRPVRAPET
ncbi:hypothetical protein BJX99DRAFT_262239 [Aspergillus californicus]